jgi:hypothetical protein
MIVRLTLGMLAGLVLSVASGCAEGPSGLEMQQRVIQDASAENVLQAAESILKREFGRVRVDRGGKRIETAPFEYTSDKDTGTARDFVGMRSVMRRKATFSLGETPGGVVARLRVDVERRDTDRQALIQPRAQRMGDTPSTESPTELDAATTREQNTVWTYVRRDRALERALLDDLRERFAPRELPEAAASQPAVAPRAAHPE